MKKAKQLTTKFNEKTQKYEKLSVQAPKGKRKIGVDQTGKIILYDDKGNIVAVQG